MRPLYDTSNHDRRIRFAQKKNAEGLTISEISFQLYSSPTTVRKYLKILPDELPEDKKTGKEREHRQALEKIMRERV